MPCRTVDLGGGAYAIVCSRGAREKRCSVCKVHVGDKLCDGRVGTAGEGYGGQRTTKPKTCDAPLCACCAATKPDPNKKGDTIDLCPKCVRVAHAG